MSQNSLIDVLEANRLLRSPDEVATFEQTLETLAQNPDSADLPSLHLILDDACEQPEVMFSLVHFLESFDMQEQVQAFIQVMADVDEILVSARSSKYKYIFQLKAHTIEYNHLYIEHFLQLEADSLKHQRELKPCPCLINYGFS